MKNIAKGIILSAFLAGIVLASPASATNGSENANVNAFLSAQASFKADVLARLESAVGIVLGPNGSLRVMGATVTSVSGSDISAKAAIGNSSLSFTLKTDAETKINGGKKGSASIEDLKVGDKISFAGTITSSTSSSIVVDAEHVVSRALVSADAKDKTSWKGEIKAINESDDSLTLSLANGRTVKVVISNSTAITLDGAAVSLESLDEGDEVKIEGSLSADGSVISATKVSAESEDADDSEDEDEDNDDDEEDESSGREGWWSKVIKWLRR